jgi:hypothetical protein
MLCSHDISSSLMHHITRQQGCQMSTPDVLVHFRNHLEQADNHGSAIFSTQSDTGGFYNVTTMLSARAWLQPLQAWANRGRFIWCRHDTTSCSAGEVDKWSYPAIAQLDLTSPLTAHQSPQRNIMCRYSHCWSHANNNVTSRIPADYSMTAVVKEEKP